MKEDFLIRMKQLIDDFNLFLASYNESPTRAVRCLGDVDLPLEKMPYGFNEYYLLSDEKYGNHPYHHLGAIYLQEPSAMAPVNTIDFKDDWLVLDMCASPGGKSGQIAERIKNGILISNEIDKKRSRILFSNIERMGYDNVIVLNNSPEELTSNFKGIFDVVLVDAPCSGEGMFRKDLDAREMWSLNNVCECQKRDLEILESANKMLKQNGFIIYSTCTFSKEENEDVITEFISKHNYKTIKPKEEIIINSTNGFIENARRFYPHRHIGEGQFMCVLQKQEETEKDLNKAKYNRLDSKELKLVNEFLKENINELNLNIIKSNNQIFHLVKEINLSGLNVISYGVRLGEVTNRFIPNHHFFKVYGRAFKNIIELDINDERIYKYLRGEEIEFETKKGYGIIMVNGLILGGFKASNGVLKNLYPKGLRNY